MSDISELFARDPLGLTIDWEKIPLSEIFSFDPTIASKAQEAAQKQGKRGPIDIVIARYRQARTQYLGGQKSAGATKKVAPKDKVKTSLDDLGL